MGAEHCPNFDVLLCLSWLLVLYKKLQCSLDFVTRPLLQTADFKGALRSITHSNSSLPAKELYGATLRAMSSLLNSQRRGGAYALAFVVTASLAAAGPCDIYASGGTACAAAHSSTRALYNSYTGALYQVTRSSDSTTKQIMPLSAGGAANSATQDSFCSGTTCVISTIYDQSGNGNDLTPAPPGGAAKGTGPNGHDLPANATAAPIYVNGHKVYGVYSPAGHGYRNDATKGIATGTEPEGIYAVLSGTHYNGGCCFDYGNAEVDNDDNNAGHMEAIYFGANTGSGTGAGSGPWIMADLENGLFSGGTAGNNQADPTIDYRFVTAVLKGQPVKGGQWEIRGGNAASGSLSTFWSGARPSGYAPMKKEGAIILGIGGDNSDGGAGTFYEGVMTSGYPSDDTDNSVQANIVAAQYSTSA